MSNIAIKSNTIFWEIDRNTSAQITINKADGWAMYDEIIMDFKAEKDINSFYMLRLTPGSGITIDGIRLIIALTYAQTAVLKGKQIYADIKPRIGNQVITPIPFVIPIKDTVTRI